ncbi:MAG TPA: hypothetical protein VMX17_15940 [Candidatus Glassbacteria bacterium]|nr:hypothetical protein [Candidatus Glassbacteria bacterium]
MQYLARKFIFHTNRVFFRQKERTKHTKESLLIIRGLAKIIIPSFFLTILIVFLLEFTEIVLLRLETIPILIKRVIYHFESLHVRVVLSTDVFKTLLATIASVSGIFLGLYFTAISVVAGSVFAKVPDNLRKLLLEEKVGNEYIHILTIVASAAIILLGYISFGGFPGVLNSLFIIIMGCFGIFCFGKLGLRVFFFFDPTTLSHAIFHKLYNNIRLSTISGFRWADPNFQLGYHKLASENISILNTLINLCAEETHLQRKPLSDIFGQTIYFLTFYEKERSRIPSDSLWYALRPHYKSWFLQNSTVVEMALRTQTSIQAEMVPYLHWIEDSIFETISLASKKAIEKKNLETVYETLITLNRYIEDLGSNLELKKGIDIIDKLGNPIEKYFSSQSSNGIKTHDDIQFALFDMYGLTILSLSLGFYKLIRGMNVQSIQRKIDSINWMNEKSIYKKGFIPSLLSKVEFIQRKLKFEKAVEKKIISPQWYIKQLIVGRYVELIHEAVTKLLISLGKFYVSKSNFLLSKNFLVLAAHHSQRGLEMCSKMRANFADIKVLLEDLEKTRINKELPWPEWNCDKIEAEIDKAHDKLVEIMAKCLPEISIIERRENYPDLFGQAYCTICEECYQAMIMNKFDKFKNLFPILFNSSLTAHEKLKDELTDWYPETATAISIGPLLDILEISGYVKLFSELSNIPEMWRICCKTWDDYLGMFKNPKRIIEFLIDVYKYHEHSFRLAPRDIVRTGWRMAFNARLKQMKLIDDEFSPGVSWLRKETVNHKSALIRILCGGRYGIHESPAEVFIIIYFLKRPESAGIEFEDKWHIVRRLREEENEDKGGIN